jgi:flagellar biosynthesis protein FlhG
VQFIQQEFAPFLVGFDSTQAAVRIERFHWIHDRLFDDGWSPERIRHALRATERRGRIIAVSSGKGGVGKTTISLNLSVAFAQCGRRTLLFDGDLGMANVHVFAGINPTVTILDVLDRRVGLSDAVTCGPAGLKVICGASGVARLASLDRRQLEELNGQLCRLATQFDVMVLDTGAGISQEVLSLLTLADEIVVVATPNLASTLDAYGLIKAGHESKVLGSFGILVNLAKDEADARVVTERLTSCAERFLNLSVGTIGWLPRAPRVEAANQSRRPIVECSPGSDFARRLHMIAAGFLPDCGNLASPAVSNEQSAAA